MVRNPDLGLFYELHVGMALLFVYLAEGLGHLSCHLSGGGNLMFFPYKISALLYLQAFLEKF